MVLTTKTNIVQKGNTILQPPTVYQQSKSS